MKLKTIKSKLSNFRNFMPDSSTIVFQSRANLNKIIKVKIQGENGIALPINFENDKEVIAFHAKTVKELMDFLNNN